MDADSSTWTRNATPSETAGVVYRLVAAGWCGQRFSRLAHDPDASGQRLEGHALASSSVRLAVMQPGKSEEADPEITVGVLVNDRNAIHRQPDVLAILAT